MTMAKGILKSVYYESTNSNGVQFIDLEGLHNGRISVEQREALNAIERCLASDSSLYYDKQDGTVDKIKTANVEFTNSGTINLSSDSCMKTNVPQEIVCIRYTGHPSKFIRSFHCNPTNRCDMGNFDGTNVAIDFTHYSHKVPTQVWSKIEILFNQLGLGSVKIDTKRGIAFNFEGDIELAKVAYLLVAEAVYWSSDYKVVILTDFSAYNKEFTDRFYMHLKSVCSDLLIVEPM